MDGKDANKSIAYLAHSHKICSLNPLHPHIVKKNKEKNVLVKLFKYYHTRSQHNSKHNKQP